MNNMFLQHLNSITPQGRAKDTKIFVPADTIKKEIEDAEYLRKLDTIDDVEELNEATRSKYLKVYGKHTVGSDERKMNLARLKRDMAMLQRGGADAATMRGAAAASGRYDRNEKPDPSYNPHDAAMAGYRFARKATRSFDAGKKSPRKATVSEATVSKANKAYRKFGHGENHNLAQLKRDVDVLRRGGASDETIRNYPAIHARGGYHNKAEITTARANVMARGMRKRREGISSPRSTNEGIQLDGLPVSEGSLGMKKGIRMSNALYGKGREDLRGRSNAAYYRTLSKINKGVGGSGRIKTSKPEDYKFSEDEYRLMQQQAARGLEGKNKNYKQYYRGRR